MNENSQFLFSSCETSRSTSISQRQQQQQQQLSSISYREAVGPVAWKNNTHFPLVFSIHA
ncbi:hypothetical protein T08_7960 [Trichinella sp. T8]|nr:hypothetical protein T08_7960 [Trichinella sp. T8]